MHVGDRKLSGLKCRFPEKSPPRTILEHLRIAGANRVNDPREHQRVAWSNAATAELPKATIIAGASATISSARLRLVSGSPAPQRISSRTLRLSLQPSCCIACRKTSTPGLIKAGARKHANEFHALVLLR